MSLPCQWTYHLRGWQQPEGAVARGELKKIADYLQNVARVVREVLGLVSL